MTQEEKQLLLKDLCGRLPYGVICNASVRSNNTDTSPISSDYCLTHNLLNYVWIDCYKLRPYLRPTSSMTEEEKEELLNLLFDKEAKHFYINGEGLIDGKTSSLMKEGLNYPAFCPNNITLYTDWLNAHHLDYRGLIEKGLAIEVTEENNPYEN